jgi:ADP-ribosylglycohydrolase
MQDITRKDRIKGAIMGGLVGDALGVGPHWYYDYDELKAAYGAWIDDYAAPKPDRYHAGLKAGESSQTGQITIMLLESVAECGAYDEADFTRRFDELLATLDGTPEGGRFTDWAIRDVWQTRHAGRDWSQVDSLADTPDAAIRSPILAARYADDMALAVDNIHANVKLTHRDPFIISQSIAFGLIVRALVNGVPLSEVSSTIPEQAEEQEVSLYFPVDWAYQMNDGSAEPATLRAPYYPALMQPGWAYAAAHDPAIHIEPASAACRLFGLACTMGFMLPAAYYLVARYEDDFEMAVLSAINGGGHNLARASLTGALSGAIVGLSGIPQRFITGLADHERILQLCGRVADAAESDG